MIQDFENKKPKIASSAFVHEGATIIGDVELAEDVSIWPGAVLRGDFGHIRIGEGSNIQDNSVVHIDELYPTVVEEHVTVGHGVMLHGCRIERGALVGIGAIVLNGVVVGAEAQVAAGALLPPGKHYPPRTLIMGSPAKVVRELSQEEIDANRQNTEHYKAIKNLYKRDYGTVG